MSEAGEVERAHHARHLIADLTQAAHLLLRLGNAVAASAGLGGPSWILLAVVNGAAEDGIRLGDLARATSLSAPNITARVRRLEAAGLVERVQDPHDGRGRRVRATTAAREALASLEAPADRAAERVLEIFGDDDLVDFAGLAARLLQRLAEVEREQGFPPPPPRP